MSRAIVAGVALLGACTVAGIPGMQGTRGASAGADDGADDAVELPVEARGKTDAPRGKMPDGIAGKLCDQEGIDFLKDNYGYDGPCWDPPGFRIAALMPGAAIRGRRAITPPATEVHTQVWWFEMPEAELDGSSHCAKVLGGTKEFLEMYEPYAEGGFTPFAVEDYKGKPIKDVLDQLDQKDLPLCVSVTTDPGCDDGEGVVCSQSSYVGDSIGTAGELRFVVGTDLIDEGTPDEQRRFPEVVGRKLDEVQADLKARGFTNVVVVEDKVQCEWGIVCMSDPYNPSSGFVGTNEKIELTVRRAKKK